MFQKQDEKVIAAGFTARELVDMLATTKAADARRALNYLDGRQEEEVIAVLNDPNCGRKDWKRRGIIPRFRNVTKMIVEKSGMLFKDQLPLLQVFDKMQNNVNEEATQILAQMFADIEFAEFMANFDQVLRLLKTAMILVQWDAEEQKFMLDILHRGNAEVITDPTTRKPMCLVYRSHENCFYVWTPAEVTELRVEGDPTSPRISVVGTMPNTYGAIPIAVFYDTATPRTGFWVEQDKSLVNLNEMVNLHITDSEFSNLWMKMATPVTNMEPAGDGNIETVDWEVQPGEKLPRPTANRTALLGGPNQVIQMDSKGVDSPFFEYKAPQIDLKQLNEVVDNWIKGYAADWSVSIRAQGEGRAESGFQLIVEEMDNLDLRKQRQRMFENGFKRLYRALRAVYNTATATNALPVESDLFAEFNAPVLPIDIQLEENVWSLRIKEKRATPIDYFMHVYGMNKEEAKLKWEEVKKFHEENEPETPPAETVAEPAQEEPIQPSINPQMGNQRG